MDADEDLFNVTLSDFKGDEISPVAYQQRENINRAKNRNFVNTANISSAFSRQALVRTNKYQLLFFKKWILGVCHFR